VSTIPENNAIHSISKASANELVTVSGIVRDKSVQIPVECVVVVGRSRADATTLLESELTEGGIMKGNINGR
jgi:DNA replicative helicase MCM subunit Mcm2 (Cdc46/Mcm family)